MGIDRENGGMVVAKARMWSWTMLLSDEFGGNSYNLSIYVLDWNKCIL
jgi:hypothetical protein